MDQAGRYETRWNQLAARVGETDETLNTALAAAMTAYQKRHSCLPGGFDSQEWEDVYKHALKAHSASAA